MSTFKKNSVAYTIPAARKNDADDDDDDDDDFTQNHKSETPHSSHVNPMHHMSSMMNSMLADPFGMMGGFGSSRHQGSGRQLMPFGFPNMNDIFQNFQMNTNDPNCHSFSSSTVMTMSSGPDGRPQVYQASHSTRTAPGGIRETQKSVCDSRTGTKKLAIGHHIGERSHVLEREQNMHSGQMEERQEFVNLDEDEAEDFNREWETKTRSGMNAIGYGQSRMRHRRPRDDIPAVLDSFSSEGSPEKSKKRCQEVVGEPSNLKEEDKTSESSGRKHLKQRKRSPRKKIN